MCLDQEDLVAWLRVRLVSVFSVHYSVHTVATALSVFSMLL